MHGKGVRVMWEVGRLGRSLGVGVALWVGASCKGEPGTPQPTPEPPAMDKAMLRPPSPTATVDTSTMARTALVVGNADYAEGPLKNPVNDAMDMSVALRQLGFEVTEIFNGSQNTILRAVIDFGTRLQTRKGVALFYYSGHGVQVEGHNYLIPVDARIASEKLVKVEAVDADRVLAEMDAAETRVNLVILDACRNNPFARSFRSPSQGLAFMDAPSGTLIAYATAPGRTAQDGTGRNGVYTSALLRHLPDQTLSIEHLLKRVGGEVEDQSQGQQSPWHSSSLRGEFLFAAKNAPVPAPAAPDEVDLPSEATPDKPPGKLTPWRRSNTPPSASSESGSAGAGPGQSAGPGAGGSGGEVAAGNQGAGTKPEEPGVVGPEVIGPRITKPALEVQPHRYEMKEVSPARTKIGTTALTPLKRLPAREVEAAP